MRIRSFVLLLLTGVIALSCKGPEGPTGPPGPGGQSLVDPTVMPKVIYTYPSNGSAGPYTDYNNRFVVWFNKIMDRTTIQHATRLTSSLSDVQLDTSTVSAANTDEFSFGALDSRGSSFRFHWKVGESYTLTVDSTARDVNGNKLLPSFAMTIKPEPVFRVVVVSPANGATDIQLQQQIRVTFNSPVDSSIFRSVRLTPAATGTWSFSPSYPAPDSTLIVFIPSGYLLDTTYTVSVDTAARDKFGNRIGLPFTFSFTTAAFHVETATPTDGTVNASLVSQITLGFTTGIDTGSVRSAFSITPAAPGELRLLAGSTTFTFVPRGHLRTSTQYTVAISTALRSRYGVPLAQPYSFSFTTLPFQTSATIPFDGASNVPLNQQLFVLLSDFVDTATARSAFSIVPPVAGAFSLRDSSQSFAFIPSQGLAPGTRYTITVQPSLHSMGGDSMAAPFVSSFTTGTFQVVSTTPANGSADVPVYPLKPITVAFNGAIDTGSVRSAFVIIPQTPGYFVLTDGASSFQFQPAIPLTLGTNYTVALSTAMASRRGDNLATPYSFTFSTVPFSVASTEPPNGSSLIYLNSEIQVTFNAPIDTTGLAAAFSVSPPVSGELLAEQNGTVVYFRPAQDLAPGTRYTVVIGTGLHSSTGAALSQPYSFSFTTAPFEVTSMSPSNGSVGVNRGTAIQIETNATLDTASISGAFSITPDVPGQIGVGLDTWRFYFTPSQPLAANTAYEVTISTALRSKEGIALSAARTFTFTTGN